MVIFPVINIITSSAFTLYMSYTFSKMIIFDSAYLKNLWSYFSL